jgi:hypothetical protein
MVKESLPLGAWSKRRIYLARREIMVKGGNYPALTQYIYFLGLVEG